MLADVARSQHWQAAVPVSAQQRSRKRLRTRDNIESHLLVLRLTDAVLPSCSDGCTSASDLPLLKSTLGSTALIAASAMPLFTSGARHLGTCAKNVEATNGILPTAMLLAMIDVHHSGGLLAHSSAKMTP